MHETNEIIGYIAGIIVTISMIPQIYKSWITKSAKDLSLTRYILYFIGMLLWTYYAFAIWNGPMILADVSSDILILFVLYLILKK
jgi:MtN3 and saliva related transmembrane protein